MNITKNNLTLTILKTLFVSCFVVVMGVFAQGCLSNSSQSSNNNGILTGKLDMAKDSLLLAVRDKTRVKIPVGKDGSFMAKLAPGRYQLLMQSKDGKLTIIKKSVSIENNLTFTVMNADMVPIPEVVSVSVPLVYNDSAIIEWQTNIESDGRIDYGKNELYGYSSYSDSELTIHHRVQIYNLQANTTYHFRIIASRYNLDSAQSKSKDYSFTTERN